MRYINWATVTAAGVIALLCYVFFTQPTAGPDDVDRARDGGSTEPGWFGDLMTTIISDPVTLVTTLLLLGAFLAGIVWHMRNPGKGAGYLVSAAVLVAILVLIFGVDTSKRALVTTRALADRGLTWVASDETPSSVVVPACSAGWVEIKVRPRETVAWQSPVTAEYFRNGTWHRLAAGAHAPAVEGFRWCAGTPAYSDRPMNLTWS